MEHSDIEHMAQGYPPSHIGKDYEEVVTELATQLLDAQKKLEESEALLYAMRQDMRESREKMEAMLGENVIARKAVQTFCDVVGGSTHAICEEVGVDGVRAILAAMSATGDMPATDAIANELRAEGVEMLANTFESQGLCTSSHTANYIRNFADQLRAGNVEGGE